MSSKRIIVSLPQTRRGRRSEAQQVQYDSELDAFAAAILKLNSRLEFTVSSRGWCYILEEHGLQKGDFDKAQRLLNDCRKSGRLPLDICKEDDSRCINGIVDEGPAETSTPEDVAARNIWWARNIRILTKKEQVAIAFERSPIRTKEEQVETAYRNARDGCRDSYHPFRWSDGLEHAVLCLVEKVDLVSLFEGTCNEYHVPIANAKGWSDLHLRAGIMRWFKAAEADGRKPVLLYCGDHDPAGLLISSTLRQQLADMSRAVNWSPDNLIIDRFGLNADFIRQHRLSWIDNLQTGSGKDLADPEHSAHDRDYVQQYLREFGPRKVEANALVTRPEAGRRLIADAIAKYIPEDWETRHYERIESARDQALEAFDRLRRG